MIGIGAANIAAGFFQGFPVSTSGSRTAVAWQNGAKTQLTGLVGAAAILVLLVFVGVLLGGGTPVQAGAAQLLVLIGLLATQTITVVVAARLVRAGRLLPAELRERLPE